ncbi:Nitrogen fixation protein [Rhodovastum atsumiense]|uniref:Nitrogen fixation protein n=1 Tax=Rhodovastum atsumiense TaxID=504468 RepID=A0A5M6IT48_9PROT|nr:NifB/NifX family molybdenum-iron cluster-binding protein [Rhodovastum atsumiense]KAA5610615.1 nitrogen fixation protein [Rhodovastum atsumiense]CAH2600734.1 Nitrogen fixation protein [Rhodovastum atsumiense]
MKIAVTSQNFRQVTGHAGRARRFLIYDVQPGAAPQETARLDLEAGQSFHDMEGVGAHPIDGVHVLLSAGFGGHFAQVMAERGIEVAITDREDPVEAVKDYLARRATGMLLPVVGCDCAGSCHGEDEAGHDHHPQPAPAG